MQPSDRPAPESVACNLCGADRTRPFSRKAGARVVQCRGCGLVYVNPRPAGALPGRENQVSQSSVADSLGVECADRRTFDEVLALADGLVPQRGRLLDVGPGVGTCLAVARERGWDVTGVETNDEAAEHCRRQRGLDVVSGALEAGSFARGSFDVVVMGNVLERLADPARTLGVVRGVLRPGGVALIWTPNVAELAGRMLQVRPDEHLYYFAPETVSALLSKAGLEVVEVRPLDRYHNLTALAHDATFGGVLRRVGPAFRLARRAFGDVVVRLPLRDNLLAVARKPAQSLAEVA